MARRRRIQQLIKSSTITPTKQKTVSIDTVVAQPLVLTGSRTGWDIRLTWTYN